MANKSKRKGNRFENQLYKEFREIVSNTKKTLGSGNSEKDADIEINEHYMIECKHYKKVTDANLDKWWKKLEKEALDKNRFPVLIYKENNRKPRVMLELLDYVVTVSLEDFKEMLEEDFT